MCPLVCTVMITWKKPTQRRMKASKAITWIQTVKRLTRLSDLETLGVYPLYPTERKKAWQLLLHSTRDYSKWKQLGSTGLTCPRYWRYWNRNGRKGYHRVTKPESTCFTWYTAGRHSAFCVRQITPAKIKDLFAWGYDYFAWWNICISISRND